MTRHDLLKILVGRARTNGFEFRHWYTTRLGVPWVDAETSFTLLVSQRRYYALLFSHEFAEAFWKSGEKITFKVAAQSFQRTMPGGATATIERKSFTRRSARRDAWRYHLREMALAEEPLRYIRKFLAVDEDLDDIHTEPGKPRTSAAKKAAVAKPQPKPLPKGLPAFLRRPFP